MHWLTPTSRRHAIALLSIPLLSYILPTAIIGYGFVIPGSCIAGINEHTIGFLAGIIGVIPTYVSGVISAWRYGAAEAVS